MTTPADRFSLRDSVAILFRHLRAILFITVLALLTVAAYLAVTATQYSAVTRVLVGIGREKMQDLGMETGPVGNLVFQERSQNINNEVEILRDPTLIGRVLPALKARLAQIPPPAEAPPRTGLRAVVADLKLQAKAAKAWLRDLGKRGADMLVDAGLITRADPDVALAIGLYRALSITAVKETDVIDVGFTWDDPVFAADALNIYLAEYQQQHLRVYETKRSVGFFQDQLKKAQDALQAVEAEQAGFLRDGGLSNFELEKTQRLTELAALRGDASAARLDQQTAQLKLAAVERAYRGGSAWIETAEAGDAVAGLQALDQSFVALLDQRTRLLARFQPGATQVRDVDGQIARLRSQKYQSLSEFYRGRLAGISERIARFDSDIAAREQALRDLTERNAGYDGIQRRLTAASALVVEYRRKLEELQVNSEMNASAFSSVRVLSEATPPVLPSFPRPALMLGLAAAFGLLAGIAYALIAEFVSRVFREPHQVARVLRLPVLASVPELPPRKWA